MKSSLLSAAIVILVFSVSCFACLPEPPEALIDTATPSLTIDIGQTITFEGDGICPENGTITDYKWVFPSEAYYIHGAETDTAKCKFSEAGTFEVKFYVKSSTGLWSVEPLAPNDDWVVTVTVNSYTSPWYVSIDGNDDNNGQSWATALGTIQMAIDTASDGHEIIVASGDSATPAIYYEQLDMKGKSLYIHTDDPDNWEAVENTIIDGNKQGRTVTYKGDESGASLEGFTIRGGYPAGDGLALHLAMDDGAGTRIADSSGKGRNAVAMNMGSNGLVSTYKRISNIDGSFEPELDASDSFGEAVASLGDLDGNGVTDLVVGAEGDDEAGSNHGALWVLFMNSDGTVDRQQKINELNGGFGGDLDSSDGFGHAVSAGDLDGDNINDIIAGAAHDDDGGTDRGAVWILFMNSDGTVREYQKISDTQGAFDGTLDDSDYFGRDVCYLGTRDANNKIQIAVGANGDDDGGTDRGAVWILSLNTDGTVSSSQKISDTAGSFSGTLDNGDGFGFSVTTVGFASNVIAVGASFDDDGGTDCGAVWVLPLNTDGTVSSSQKISNTAGSFGGTLDSGDRFGYEVTSVGDLNSDGNADIAVGAAYDDDGGEGRGAVWVLFLNADYTVDDYQKISDTEGDFGGVLYNYEVFGKALAGIGDIDGDGVPDIAVASHDTAGGSVWILFMDSAAVWTSDRNGDGALFFDGTDDYIELDGYKGVVSSTSRTCSAWVKIDETFLTTGAILTWGESDTGENWSFRLRSYWNDPTSSKLEVGVWGGAVRGSKELNDGLWHHVAVVLEDDGDVTLDKIRLFVDGVRETEIFYNYTGCFPEINTMADGDVLVGAQRASDGQIVNFFEGSIDDVRIYSRALNENEIEELAGLEHPILHLKMDDNVSDGYTTDSSENGYDGQVFGATLSTDGYLNNALSFDGDDYVTVSESILNPDVTVFSAFSWVRLDNPSSTSYQVILQQMNAGGVDCGRSWLWRSTDNKLCSSLGGSATSSTNAVFSTGQWCHVGMTYDGQTVRLYANGQLCGSSARNAEDCTGQMLIGIHKGMDSDTCWNGLIDDVRIYPRVLSVDEIGILADNHPNLMTHLKFESEDASRIIQDNSGNGCYGKAHGGVSIISSDGVLGNCASFNGVGNYSGDDTCSFVDLYGSASYNQYSVSLWFNTSIYSNEGVLIQDAHTAGTESHGRPQISVRFNKAYINGGDPIGYATYGTNFYSAVGMADGNWHHLVTTTNTTTDEIELYVDGRYYGSYDNDGLVFPLNLINGGDNYTRVEIGARTKKNLYYDGLIDELKIYNTVLDADEVKMLYSHASAVQPPAMIAHYRLDGDCTDSANSNDGSLVEDPVGSTSFEPGVIGQALKFDGSAGNFVQLDPLFNPGKDEFSVFVWARLDAKAGSVLQTIVAQENVDGNGRPLLSRQKDTDLLYCYLAGVATVSQTAVFETLGQWHHVGLTYDGRYVSLYVDGRKEATDIRSGELTEGGIRLAQQKAEISPFETQAPWNGALDDVRIYNYALSEEEVHGVYDLGGGIRGCGASIAISKCIINDNISQANGGGVSNLSGSIENCFITGNKTVNADGGGLAGCDADIINSVIAENTAENAGAILGNTTATTGSITNCTIVNNNANNSIGGIKDCVRSITNTILWGNGDSVSSSIQDAQIKDCSSAAVSYSCIQDDTIDDTHYVGDGNIDDDPLLKIDGYHLGKNSPCINKAVFIEELPLLDIDGQDRTMGTILDIGADEVPNILYVNQFYPGQIQDGSSWQRAYEYLQDALAEAGSYSQIWVAEGIYTPDQGEGKTPYDRSASFTLIDDVEVYGGFEGFEESASERNWIEFPTILSGDLNGNDSSGVKTDNSYHIVTGADNATLDGFRIVGGYANGSGNDSLGAGILNLSASPMIRNCVIIGNQAADKGGGIYNDNCVASVLLSSCNVIYNSAGSEGGGMYNNNANAILTNCIFWGNTAGTGVSIVNSGTSETVVSYSDIQGSNGSGSWNSSIGTDGGNNIDADPLFVDYDGADNVLGTEDDDYSFNSGSPCLIGGVAGESIGVVAQDDVQIIDQVAVNDPVDIEFHNDRIFVLSSTDHTISVFDEQLVLQTFYFADDTLTVDAVNPKGMCIDNEGSIYVVDTGGHRVLRYAPQGILDATFAQLGILGSQGTGDGQFESPWGIALDWEGNIYISDSGNDRVQVFDSTGQFIAKWGTPGSEDGQFDTPKGICLPGSSEISVVDSGNNRIQNVSTHSGSYYSQIGESGSFPSQLNNASDIFYEIDHDQLVIADAGNNRIQIFQLSSTGEYSDDSITFVKEISDQGLSSPLSLTCDPGENSQTIYIADTGNNRIVKVTVEFDSPENNPLFIWEAFKNSLRGNDVSRSLSFVSDASVEAYSQIFNDPGMNLQDYVTGMGTMALDSFSSEKAKYEMQHVDGGTTYSFPVIFTKDDDGQWKIFSF